MTSITIVKLNKVLSISWTLIRLATDIIKQIKNTSLKLSFKYIDNFANLKGTDFDLISRNDLNLDEIEWATSAEELN